MSARLLRAVLVVATLFAIGACDSAPGAGDGGGGGGGSGGGTANGGGSANGGGNAGGGSGGSAGGAGGMGGGGANDGGNGGSGGAGGGSAGGGVGGAGGGGIDSGTPDAGDSGTPVPNSCGLAAFWDAGVSSDAGAVDAGKLPYDWYAFIATGQSLSVGAAAPYVLSVTQTQGNLKLKEASGNYPIDGGGTWSLVPLVEPIRPIPGIGGGAYPNNIAGETPSTSMANTLSNITTARYGTGAISLHSNVGWSGMPIQMINKDGGHIGYKASLMEVTRMKAFAADAGKKFAVGAIVLTHGESDQYNAIYGSQLYDLWNDYNQDLKAITGQAEAIPLILSQQNTFPFGWDAGHLAVPSSEAQWKAGVDHPGKIICAGPKYQYKYGDFVHLDVQGYRRLGEKYAEVFDIVVNQKKSWAPLQPIAAATCGANVAVKFHVPNPPLQWDAVTLPNHQSVWSAWAKGKGFEVLDSTGDLTILSADIVGDTVVLTLDKPPTGTGLQVRYATSHDAYTFIPAVGGEINSRRGLLRDSDAFIGANGQFLGVRAVNDSGVLLPVVDGGFAHRARGDFVVGGGLPPGTVITDIPTLADGGWRDRMVLSNKWAWDSGTGIIAVWHDQRNYAVQFSILVPYP